MYYHAVRFWCKICNCAIFSKLKRLYCIPSWCQAAAQRREPCVTHTHTHGLNRALQRLCFISGRCWAHFNLLKVELYSAEFASHFAFGLSPVLKSHPSEVPSQYLEEEQLQPSWLKLFIHIWPRIFFGKSLYLSTFYLLIIIYYLGINLLRCIILLHVLCTHCCLFCLEIWLQNPFLINVWTQIYFSYLLKS